MDTLSLLQSWYLAQCNGDWEHGYGIRLETVDNPGWRLRIDLCGTDAEGLELDRVSVQRTETDWLTYGVEKNEFQAAMGPENLVECVGIFLKWFESSNLDAI
jgi:hypothetical protein